MPSQQTTDSIWEMENPIGSSSSKNENLWFIITILCVIIFIGSFILFGFGDFLGKTVGNTLIFISDTITDWGIAFLKIFNGTIHDITRFILPVKDSNKPVKDSDLNKKIEEQAKIMPVSTPAVNKLAPPTQTNQVEPSSATNSSWCFVGESNNKRSCVAVNNPKNVSRDKFFLLWKIVGLLNNFFLYRCTIGMDY